MSSFCASRSARREAPVNAPRTDDGDLARRIQAGDQPAFRELVERHQSRIFQVIYGILHSPQDAEEIAQEVFAKVYFSIQTFDGRSSLFTWIYRIAVNECFAHLRKRSDGRPTADRAFAQRDLVNKLLARIPTEDRVLLLWKEVEDFSIVQLAEMAGLNESTVKGKLFHARRRLAEIAVRLSRRPV